MTLNRWFLVLALYLASLILAYLISLTPLGSQTIRIGIELDTLLLVTTLLFSTAITFLLLMGSKERSAIRRAVARSENEAVDERRRFLRRLDHEFKNPLTAIRAGLANLDSSNREEAWQEIRSSIESQVLRLSQLTSDLRKLADLESRPLQERDLVQTDNLLLEAFEAAQESFASEDRELSLTMPQAPWPLPPVMGDRDLLFLAIFNLLDNALKYTRSGDKIEVRAMDRDDHVVIEVADTGMGIPNDEADHIWEELYRGRDAQGVPGSGLGLSLVKPIVERHDGRLELRSKADHGTVFSVRLPQASYVSDL